MKSPIVLFALFLTTQSVKLPPEFMKCNRKDPNWKECMFKAGVHGLSLLTKPWPELNIPNLEPLFIPKIDINAGSQTIQFTQHFTNSTFYGLTKVKADVFDFDFEKKTITLEGTFPEIRILGTYKFDGKVLLLPIVGEGTGETKISNLHVKSLLRYEEFKKKNKTYIRIVSGDLKLIPGLIRFKFDNLFNGDKTLGDNINQVLNDNWEAVFQDIEQGYTELVLKIFINLNNSFFSKVSIEEALD